jgi:uncharacterized membrane protein YgcG
MRKFIYLFFVFALAACVPAFDDESDPASEAFFAGYRAGTDSFVDSAYNYLKAKNANEKFTSALYASFGKPKWDAAIVRPDPEGGRFNVFVPFCNALSQTVPAYIAVSCDNGVFDGSTVVKSRWHAMYDSLQHDWNFIYLGTVFYDFEKAIYGKRAPEDTEKPDTKVATVAVECTIRYCSITNYLFDSKGNLIGEDTMYSSTMTCTYTYVGGGGGSGGDGGGSGGNGNGNGGGGGGGSSGSGNNGSNNSSSSDPLVNSVNSEIKSALETVLNELKNDCLGAYIYNKLISRNVKLDFILNNSPDAHTGGYLNNSISFNSIRSVNYGIMTEELIHALQDKVYGITAMNNARENVEFEAKMIRELLGRDGFYNGMCCASELSMFQNSLIKYGGDSFSIWFIDTQVNRTSGIPMDWGGYKFFEKEFGNVIPLYKSTYNPNFSPDVLKQLINDSKNINCMKI